MLCKDFFDSLLLPWKVAVRLMTVRSSRLGHPRKKKSVLAFINMTPTESLVWKVVCVVLASMCARMHTTGFLTVGLATAYILLSLNPPPMERYTSESYQALPSVSARAAETEATPTPETVRPRIPNWRKTTAPQPGPTLPPTFETTPARQPTLDQKKRLMQVLYDEMRNRR